MQSLQCNARGLLWLAAFTTFGCSVLTKWDPNHLPCHKDAQQGTYTCASNYSCTMAAGGSTQCVADHSLQANEPCWNDRQCADGYSCPDGICRRSCDPAAILTTGKDCPFPGFCAAFLSAAMYSDGQAHTPQLVAGCKPTNGCTAGQPCTLDGGASGGICVALGTGITTCEFGCQTSFTAQKYGDNCGNLKGTEQASCAAVGLVGAQQTICVQASFGARQPGDSCNNAVGQPCTSGYGCFEGRCAQWCEPTQTSSNNCPANQLCCHRQLNPTQLIGFCATQCPAS